MVKFGENNEVIQENEYRAILVGVDLDNGESIDYYMDELEGLAEAVNAQVLGRMIQNRERPDTAYYIGRGKAEELAEMCQAMEANIVIFNNELSGIQIRNLEDVTGVSVIDRTILILDIFAARATSAEGKLQVEMAQLKYRLPRLLGFGRSLSRTGGGIGTRGPGEKKLETDRRHIQRRIDDIRREIDELKKVRANQRNRREKAEIPVVALVGYTNAGKSAVMNYMLGMTEKENKDVFEKNMLFATLDTSQRRITLDTNHSFILTDTVGFVSRLPHTLVKAFMSTLEEVVLADLLVYVIDGTTDRYAFHLDVTEKVIEEIGAGERERIIAFNKMDLLEDEAEELAVPGEDCVFISAKTGQGMEDLVEMIKQKLFANNLVAELLIPYDKGNISSYICEKCTVLETDYREDGTYFRAELTPEEWGRLARWRINAPDCAENPDF